MGGTSSKLEVPELPAAPTQEEIFSHSTVSADYAQKIADQASEAQAKATEFAQQAAAELESATFWFRAKLGGGIFIILAFAAVLVWYFVWGPFKKQPDPLPTLNITSATYAGNDVKAKVISKITSGNTLTLTPPLSTEIGGVTGCTGSVCSNIFTINY